MELIDRCAHRKAKRRLAIIRHVEEVTCSVAMTCRYYGISRQTITGGTAGSRRRGSKSSGPIQEAADVSAGHPERSRRKISTCGQNYHFGPNKIRMYFTRASAEVHTRPSPSDRPRLGPQGP